ncbi:SemiSWEET transporter [Actinoplanes sp. NPDC049668]|uniref:SemiSWEET transporter n=1 Tax=unclassified Actinoplanes TaxID=2626549 RepID=UPI0033AE1AEB
MPHTLYRKRIMLSSAVLGWLGAALSMTLLWPQVWRTVAKGHTNGLCAVACWQGVAMPVGWIVYGLLTQQAVQVVTNTVTGFAGLLILAVLLVKRSELRTGRRLLTGAAGAAAVLGAVALSAALAATTDLGIQRVATALGLVLAVAATLSAVPQPLSLLRDRTQDLAGLSPLRWWLTAACTACWSAYGVATGQVAVWLSASVGLAAALVVCWVMTTAGRTAPRPAAAPALRPHTAGPRIVHPAAPFAGPSRPATTGRPRIAPRTLVRPPGRPVRPQPGGNRPFAQAGARHADPAQ